MHSSGVKNINLRLTLDDAVSRLHIIYKTDRQTDTTELLISGLLFTLVQFGLDNFLADSA